MFTCIVLAAVIAFSLWYFTYGAYDGAYKGMSVDDFFDQVPEERCFCYLGYIFYNNQLGDPVVAQRSDDYKTISEIRSFSKYTIRPNRLTAEGIHPGMSVYDVVSKLGTPVGTATFGMITLAFDLEGGVRCVVYLGGELSDSDLVVTSVVFYE